MACHGERESRPSVSPASTSINSKQRTRNSHPAKRSARQFLSAEHSAAGATYRRALGDFGPGGHGAHASEAQRRWSSNDSLPAGDSEGRQHCVDVGAKECDRGTKGNSKKRKATEMTRSSSESMGCVERELAQENNEEPWIITME